MSTPLKPGDISSWRHGQRGEGLAVAAGARKTEHNVVPMDPMDREISTLLKKPTEDEAFEKELGEILSWEARVDGKIKGTEAFLEDRISDEDRARITAELKALKKERGDVAQLEAETAARYGWDEEQNGWRTLASPAVTREFDLPPGGELPSDAEMRAAPQYWLGARRMSGHISTPKLPQPLADKPLPRDTIQTMTEPKPVQVPVQDADAPLHEFDQRAASEAHLKAANAPEPTLDTAPTHVPVVDMEDDVHTFDQTAATEAHMKATAGDSSVQEKTVAERLEEIDGFIASAPANPTPEEKVWFDKLVRLREDLTKNNTPKSLGEVTAPSSSEEKPNTRFEDALRKIHARDPEQASRILTTIEGKGGKIRERFLKLTAAAEEQKDQQESRVKEKFEKKTFEFIKRWGQKYQKIPLPYKVALGVTLAGGALLSTGALSAVFATGIGVRRLLAGAATAVTVEAFLERRHERTGWTRPEFQETRDRRIALMLGALVGGGGYIVEGVEHASAKIASLKASLDSLYGHTQTILGNEPPVGVSATPPATQNIFNSGPTPNAAFYDTLSDKPPVLDMVDHSRDAAGEMIHKVTSGENLWNIIKGNLAEHHAFDNLSHDQQIYLNDEIKDTFANMSQEQLKEIGITSGDIDLIHPDDHIDLSKVMGDRVFMDHALEKAQAFHGTLSHESVVPHPAEHAVTIPSNVDSSAATTEWIEDPTQIPGLAPHGSADSFNITEHPVATLGEQVAQSEYMVADIPLNEQAQHSFESILNYAYPSADGRIWAPGESSSEWRLLSNRSAWELMYRQESLVGNREFPIIAHDATTERVRAVLKAIMERTGIKPSHDEGVGRFLARAINVAGGRVWMNGGRVAF